MVAPVDRPRGVLAGTFGVGILTFLLLPSEVGYQDLAALIARDVASVERPQKASLASPFGTIHAANLNLPQPIGSGIQPALGYTLASLDPTDALVARFSPRLPELFEDLEPAGDAQPDAPGGEA